MDTIFMLPTVRVVTLDAIKEQTLRKLVYDHQYLAVYANDFRQEILMSRIQYNHPYDEILMNMIAESCSGNMKYTGHGYEWRLSTTDNPRAVDLVTMYHVECSDEHYVVIWRNEMRHMLWAQRRKELNMIIEAQVVAEATDRYVAHVNSEKLRRKKSWFHYIQWGNHTGYAF
jgi:hypothetical protein